MENKIIKTETTPAALLQLAVQQNLDIDKLEKLLALQERWQAGEARKEFLSAISLFQSQVPALEKTKLVAFGQTKYKYAPLGEIAATIKTAMAENGLSHRWEIADDPDKITCTCIISHISGHSEKTAMGAAKDASGGKNEIQQRGSAITYLQRYTLIAALGISTADEDNDAQDEKKPEVKKTEPVKVEKKTIPSGMGNGVHNATTAADAETDFIIIWQDEVANCKTVKELYVLYNGNKATVDLSPEIKAMFKAREEIIKSKKQTA